MEVTKRPTNSDDYAVAYELNLRVLGLIMLVHFSHDPSVASIIDIQEINRVYILVVDELQKLYDNNPKLSEIKPEPIWKRFEVIKFYSKEIKEYVVAESHYGGNHFAKVEKLCILSNADVENPRYTPEQKRLIDRANEIVVDFESANEARNKNKANDWQIPEYTLTFNFDGTILINDALKLKKVHASSTTERLLDQAIKNPNTLFKPDIGQTSRNLSTVLSGAGFTNELRALFFPVASKSRGVFFRPVVTRQQADDDNIDTAELDTRLKELGAKTEPKTSK